MSQFLDDLHFFCTADTPPPSDPEYRAAMKALCDIEEQIEKRMGKDFFLRYDEVSHQAQMWQLWESFRAGLRFGANFILEVWGQSSQAASPSRVQPAFTSPQE
jgi:hypothetical protein